MVKLYCDKSVLVDPIEDQYEPCGGEFVFRIDGGYPGSFLEPPEPPEVSLVSRHCTCTYTDEEMEKLHEEALEKSYREEPPEPYDYTIRYDDN